MKVQELAGLDAEIAACQECRRSGLPAYEHRPDNARAARRWMPRDVKLVVVGESPPADSRCYFYRSPTRLFCATARAVLSREDVAYGHVGQEEHASMLSMLAEARVFLVDSARCPIKMKIKMDGSKVRHSDRKRWLCQCSGFLTRELGILRPQAVAVAGLGLAKYLDRAGILRVEPNPLVFPGQPSRSHPHPVEEFVEGLRQVLRKVRDRR